MSKKMGKWGGEYALLETLGGAVRYAFHCLIHDKQSFKHLSGEDNYPEIDTRQRIACLVVGIISSLAILALLALLITLLS